MLKNHKVGFSIVEVMTVIAIIAVLVALALPSFNDYFEKARLRGAADSLVGLLAQSRSEAVKRNRQTVVTKVGGGAVWCVGATIAADPSNVGDPLPAAVPCDCSDGTPSCSLGTISSTDARGVTAGANAFEVTFNPKYGGSEGFVSPTTSFTSQSGRFDLSVRASSTGQARICRTAGSGTIYGYMECES